MLFWSQVILRLRQKKQAIWQGGFFIRLFLPVGPLPPSRLGLLTEVVGATVSDKSASVPALLLV